MNTDSTPLFQNEPDYGAAHIQANLRKLERHDLWVWSNAAIIILSLTAAIFSLSVSFYLKGEKKLFRVGTEACGARLGAARLDIHVPHDLPASPLA